jgi:hypothetical protein
MVADNTGQEALSIPDDSTAAESSGFTPIHNPQTSRPPYASGAKHATSSSTSLFLLNPLLRIPRAKSPLSHGSQARLFPIPASTYPTIKETQSPTSSNNHHSQHIQPTSRADPHSAAQHPLPHAILF